MSEIDQPNPGAGSRVSGYVVSIEDPENLGRVLVEFDIQGPAGIPADKLQWIDVMQGPKEAPNRYVGSWPGHNFTPGAKLILNRVNYGEDSSWVVAGAVRGKKDTQNQTKDINNPESLPKVPTFNNGRAAKELQEAVSEGGEGGLQGLTKEAARRFNDVLKPGKTKDPHEDPIERLKRDVSDYVNKIPNSGMYSSKGKNVPRTLAHFQRASTAAGMKNPSEFIMNTLGKEGFQMAKTPDQFKSLAAAVTSGGMFDSNAAVGGLANVVASLASIGKLVSNQIEDEDKALEEYMCSVFASLFPGVPCEPLSAAFVAWSKEFQTTEGLV